MGRVRPQLTAVTPSPGGQPYPGHVEVLLHLDVVRQCGHRVGTHRQAGGQQHKQGPETPHGSAPLPRGSLTGSVGTEELPDRGGCKLRLGRDLWLIGDFGVCAAQPGPIRAPRPGLVDPCSALAGARRSVSEEALTKHNKPAAAQAGFSPRKAP